MGKTKYINIDKPSNRDEMPLLQPRFYLNNNEIERWHSLKFPGLMIRQKTKLLKIAKRWCLGPLISESLKHLYVACIHCFLNYENIKWANTHKT